MSSFISRILVFFYVIFFPLFVGLYIAAYVSSYPKPAALWIEGGASEFGPAAFIVLLILLCVPLLLSFAKYLLSGDSTELGKVLIICAILFAHPVLGAFQAHPWEKGFPMQVLLLDWDKGVFLGIIALGLVIVLPFGGIGSLIYEIHELAEAKDQEAKAKDQERKYFAELSARCRVGAHEVSQLMAVLVEHNKLLGYGRRIESRVELSRQYLPRHLTLMVKSGLPVDAYLLFVERAVGQKNVFNDAAFVELERHIHFFSETGGMEQHFRWLEAMDSRSLRDESFGLYPSHRYGSSKISLSESLVEFKLGEFSTPDEYLEFVKVSPGYVSYTEREQFKKELEMMSHPVLLKMFEVGGAHRARALQIVRRSQGAAKAEKARAILPDVGIAAAPTPPQVAPMDLVMISRGGQIILRDIKLQNLSTMVMQGQVLLTDHYWCSGMAGWSLVSAYRSSDAPRHVPEEGVNWGEVFTDFFLSWMLYVLGGVFIAALIGYGNGGMPGAGSAIGGFLGFIIMVRPVTFVFRTIFRLAIGKRGMELFR